jgi:hypothetical protein
LGDDVRGGWLLVLVDPGQQVIEVGRGELPLEGSGGGVVALLEVSEALFDLAIWLFDTPRAASSTILSGSHPAERRYGSEPVSSRRCRSETVIWQARKAGTNAVLHGDHKQ